MLFLGSHSEKWGTGAKRIFRNPYFFGGAKGGVRVARMGQWVRSAIDAVHEEAGRNNTAGCGSRRVNMVQ